jgi:hypothetical protein
MTQLRQMVNLRERKVKSKAWDSLLFGQIIDKETQRITQEN